MKKLLALSVAFALLASAVFAEEGEGGITLGAWARTAFVPLDITDGDNTPWIGTTWGGASSVPRIARVDFNGVNNDGTLGFRVELKVDNDGSAPGFGDTTKIWAQPWKWLRLDIGKYEADELRGKVSVDTAFNAFVGGGESGDVIFHRINSWSLTAPGALVSITPVEGLFLAANFQNIGEANGGADDGEPIDYVFAAGYKFSGVHIRAQYGTSGSNAGTWDAGGADGIEAAIGYDGIEGLTLDVGAHLATKGDVFRHLGFGVSYNADKFGIGTVATLDFGTDVKFGIYAEPTFNLGPVVLGIPVHFDIEDGKGDIGAGGYVKYPLTNGYIQTGLGATIPYGDGAPPVRLAVPIIVELWL